MKKLLIFALLPLFLSGPVFAEGYQYLRIKAGKKIELFTVEIPTTREEQEHGLMGRQYLPDHHGMLFIFPKELVVKMWMKDTPLSLDMIFVNRSGAIVYIVENTIPNSTNIISSGAPVYGVLEVAAGTSKALGFKAGHQLIHPVFKP